MRCHSARKLLSRRIDGRLVSREAPPLEAHLARCAVCGEAAARLERAWSRLGALPAPGRSPDDLATVLERLDARPRGLAGWLGSLLPAVRPAFAAAIAACILVGATAGATLGRAAMRARGSAATPEARALVEGLGVLPFGSPAAGLARALALGTEGLE